MGSHGALSVLEHLCLRIQFLYGPPLNQILIPDMPVYKNTRNSHIAFREEKNMIASK